MHKYEVQIKMRIKQDQVIIPNRNISASLSYVSKVKKKDMQRKKKNWNLVQKRELCGAVETCTSFSTYYFKLDPRLGA